MTTINLCSTRLEQSPPPQRLRSSCS